MEIGAVVKVIRGTYDGEWGTVVESLGSMVSFEVQSYGRDTFVRLVSLSDCLLKEEAEQIEREESAKRDEEFWASH